jgi:uncharacterized Fe-S cluster-containing radical SAM superfamily protein
MAYDDEPASQRNTPATPGRAIMEEFHMAKAFARDEPRVELVEAMLKSLLRVVELEHNGVPVQVDGFRLRDLNQWRTAHELSLQENLGSFSTVCNCKCAFCYEDGNPEGLFAKQPRFVSLEEAQTRLRYLHDGRGLLRESKGFFEPFVNPDFLTLLELIRRNEPDHIIDVTTNGALLTPDVVVRLAALKPIYLNISLNSANEALRRGVMGDPHASTAIQAVELLRASGIPFMGTIVAWPDQGLDDVSRTIEYMDSYDAYVIRVALPGLTRHHPSYEPGVVEAWWPKVAERAMALRTELRTPVIISPYAYVSAAIEPIIEGIVAGSPASAAGIKLGDCLVSVNGKPVVSRAHAASLLRRAAEAGGATVDLLRDGSPLRFDLREPDREADLYPYKPRGYRPLDTVGLTFGLCLPGSFHLQYLKQIHAAIEDRRARNILLIVSPFYQELVSKLVAGLPLPEGARMQLVVPHNEFFGGNVGIGDLWVLDDIASAVRPHLDETDRPDLVLLPDSFLSRWGRDLRGVSYRELESVLGIDVVLVHCERIMM